MKITKIWKEHLTGETQVDVPVLRVQIRVILPAMARLPHRVVLDALQDVQAVVLGHAVAAVPVPVEVVAHRVVQVRAAVDAPAHVAAVAPPDVLLGAKALVARGARLDVRENVPAPVVQVALRDAPDNVGAVARRDVLRVAKPHVQETVLTVVTPFAVVVVNIHVAALVNMSLLDHHVPAAREHAQPIVITHVVWLAVQAVCLVAYPHLNDLESNKRTRSRLAIWQS